ncbi:DUF434 domain-containing protein [Nitrosophilus kaiyonis]|uniref:DUF434 domain-containing protein n=1 Tax=Nitrosophilus kaiyonis TaxID=2930200 RepID=UPI0024911727|nr:DUF434 domain-containing protein [Nitrosophilus kaiyonis]
MRHRGAFDTSKLFKNLENLKKSVYDAIFLIKRGYKKDSVIDFVSNHYQLYSIQRDALYKAATIKYKRGVRSIKNKKVYIDGFNILITAETALAKSIIIKCYDGCYRDLSSVYGNYRFVFETDEAIKFLFNALKVLETEEAIFVFDKKVSNSIKLSNKIQDLAKKENLNIKAVAIDKVDRFLKNQKDIVITCDSAIIKDCKKWFNISSFLYEKLYKSAKILDLSLKGG